MEQILQNEIKMILDITSRVDERVKIIQALHQETNTRLEKLAEDVGELGDRVTKLESSNGGKHHKTEEVIHQVELKMERLDGLNVGVTFEKIREKLDLYDMRIFKLEEHRDSWMNQVRHYSGLVVQGIWVIVVCYLLYRLGLNPPPMP